MLWIQFAVAMLNRRQLRIKVLHALYAFYSDEGRDTEANHKLLFKSIDKMYDMYLLLMLLISKLQDAAIEKIEMALEKKLPTHDDLHPNTKFVNNKPLRVVVKSKNLAAIANERKLSWKDDSHVIKHVFRELLESEEYKQYMDNSERGFAHDREALNRIFRKEIVNNELLQDWFEEHSIMWADDLDLASSIVLKTIKTIDEKSEDFEVLALWNDDGDDKKFLSGLFAQTLDWAPEHDKLIAEAADNWEFERIALMDRLILRMALAEAREFSQVPLKVTLNEYIELAKYYSTEKSSAFVNGVLDGLFKQMSDDGTIVKSGRGLIQ
jgi:N utilization substance protein B